MIRLKKDNREIVFDGCVFVLHEKDFGSVQAQHNSYKGAGQIGEYLRGMTLGTRNIQIVGYILADGESEMRQLKTLLRHVVNPQQPFTLHCDGYKITVHSEDTVKFAVSYAQNNDKLCKFQISGLCFEPRFETEQQTKILAASWQPMFSFPLCLEQPIIMGEKTNSNVFELSNTGETSVGMAIRLSASGDVVAPNIVNVRNREYFGLAMTLLAGDSVTINTNYGQKSVVLTRNEVQTNILPLVAYGSSFLQLDMGNSLFRYEAQENAEALKVEVMYSEKVWGV
ncbi:MAG: phage tail family protein [Christensenellaceae bacterium]